MFRRRGVSRAPKRKIDTDWAGLRFGDSHAPVSDFAVSYAEWVRVPAAALDTATDLEVEPNHTLVDTICRWELEADFTGVIGSSGVMRWDIGIIAVPGFQGDAVPADVPIPMFAAHPWVWRSCFMHYETFVANGSRTMYAWNRFEPIELIRSRGQRRLPDGVGLLMVLYHECVVGGLGLSYGWTLQTDTVMRSKAP